MARITIYKNSILASAVSIFAYFFIIGGALVMVEGEFLAGILCVVIGIGLMVLAGWISSHKAFRKWWKQVEKQGLIPEIRNSSEIAVAVYQKNPEKRTLGKIRALNPAAAVYIENGCKGPVPQAAVQQPVHRPVQQPVQQPVQRSVQQPVQQPVQRPVQQPVQQPVQRPVQQPVQQPVQRPVQQPVQPPVQQPIRQAAPASVNAAQQQESQILQQLWKEKNSQDKFQVEQAYYKAVSELCMLCQTPSGNAELARRTLELGNEYLHHSCEYSFSSYRLRHDAALKLVAVEEAFNLPAQTRRFYVVHSAVHAGLTAGDTGNRAILQSALEMLQVASGYRMELNRDVDRHYMNVSIPTIRCWLQYGLAKTYMMRPPADFASARSLLQEAANNMPMDPIRMSDMNPHLDWNNQEKLTGEMIRTLLQSIPQ